MEQATLALSDTRRTVLAAALRAWVKHTEVDQRYQPTTTRAIQLQQAREMLKIFGTKRQFRPAA